MEAEVELLDAGEPSGTHAHCVYRITTVCDGHNEVMHINCNITDAGDSDFEVGDQYGPFSYQFRDGCWNVLVVPGSGNLHNQTRC